MKAWPSWISSVPQYWASSENVRYKSFISLRNTTEIVSFLSQNAGTCTSGQDQEITKCPGKEIFISRTRLYFE